MKTWITLGIVGLLLLSLAASYTVSTIKNVASAYLYGYPLVLMEQSRLVSSTKQLAVNGKSSNQFTHLQQLPDHTFRDVVRPNNDTLYSSAWINLDREPIVLNVPDTNGRYYVMPFMDAWTNVFALVGKRTTGTQEGAYAVVGPNWKGVLPSGVVRIESPTNMVWLVGRIQVNGKEDIANVVALQSDFSLTPLSQWPARVSESIGLAWNGASAESPMEKVDAFDAKQFFSRLSKLIATQPGADDDFEAQRNLAYLGVAAEHPFKNLGPIDSFLFNKAIDITHSRLNQRLNSRTGLENGWLVYRSIIGNYLTNYEVRAGVAKIGLGALPPVEAAYPNTRVSVNGEVLSGRNRYKIHFENAKVPPVNAFWSLSMYDENGFFTDNAIGRYSIGDRDALKYNPNGSLDILIQLEEPESGKSNWLPAPIGKFALTMRLYSPKESFLKGEWQLPSVETLAP